MISEQPSLNVRAVWALALSAVCILLLANIARAYYSILNSAGLMGSYVDGRGGLWEVNGAAPMLTLMGILSAVVAARLSAPTFMTRSLAFLCAVLWLSIVTLAHFIRTSLR